MRIVKSVRLFLQHILSKNKQSNRVNINLIKRKTGLCGGKMHVTDKAVLSVVKSVQRHFPACLFFFFF